MRRHGVAGAVTAMAVRTADDPVPAHCLRTGKKLPSSERGRDAVAPSRPSWPSLRVRLSALRRTTDTRTCAAGSIRSTPVCRRLAHDHRGARPSLPARSAQQTASWFRQLADL